MTRDGSPPRTPLGALPGLPPGTPARVAGRIFATRPDGGILVDASGSARLAEADWLEELSLVEVSGCWDGQRLRVERGTVLARNQRCQGSGSRYESVALLGDGRRKLMRLTARAQVLRQVRAYFDGADFLEVETPLVVPSPGLDLHLSAPEVRRRQGSGYLITSPEYQMKRLLAGGLERIYQITKCFREDEVGDRHQPEFTMLEWYRAYADVDAVMQDTERLVAHIARQLNGAALLRTAFGEVDVTPPWPRIRVQDALARFCGRSLDEVAHDESLFFRLLVEQVEPALAELGAVFLIDYPIAQASLARPRPDDPRLAERFEAYVAGIELCNGFGELTCPREQRARLSRDQAQRRALELPVYPIDEAFLAALEEGMPPSGGNALGLDRLVMLALGASHIEDVIAIPASRL